MLTPTPNTLTFSKWDRKSLYLNDTVQQQAESKGAVDNKTNTLQFKHVTARPSQNYNLYTNTKQIGMTGLSVV